ATPAPTSCTTFWGPRTFTRTTGTKDVFTETITIPASLASPFVLRVQNGNTDGTNRLSSATIEIDGAVVASPPDFNQNVAGFDRAVTLTARTTLKVTLASAPGSLMTLSLCGLPSPCTTFWGPQKFTRTNGPKDVFTATITVPVALASAFNLHVQNG